MALELLNGGPRLSGDCDEWFFFLCGRFAIISRFFDDLLVGEVLMKNDQEIKYL